MPGRWPSHYFVVLQWAESDGAEERNGSEQARLAGAVQHSGDQWASGQAGRSVCSAATQSHTKIKYSQVSLNIGFKNGSVGHISRNFLLKVGQIV